MKSRWHWLVSVLAVLALVASACAAEEGGEGDGGTDTTAGEVDLSGTEVTLFGPESSDEEAGAFQDAVNVFAEENGMTVTYTGARDFSDQINAQAAGGNPPDIAIFPQPGKLADFADEGFILPLPDSVVAEIDENWSESWKNFGNVDGTQYGVPNKSDLKSIVWYNVAAFEEGGYEIPQTWDELLDLTDQMIADGETPWCVGIESGPATGWPLTDWVEDLMLRFHGADVYDEWVDHDIPFNDDRVVEVMGAVGELWNTEGAVYAAGGSIAATPFGDNGQPLADGTCLMHRQASFFAAFMPEGTEFGPDADVDTFYFPAVDPDNTPTLVAGTLAGAFRDAPEVWAVMEYLASAEYANERQAAQQTRKGGSLSGYLSANLNQDLSNYLPLEQGWIEILQTGDPARFDGSDLMPAAVGSGEFWTAGTSFVTGELSAEEAAAQIEEAWPTE